VPSTALRPERSIVAFVVIAAATIAARLPFLLRADRFFDADEAVEGLMARHVLQGEHPLFLWGQRYKGVPEVYLSAAVFRVASPSVVALKAVSLACFVVFVCLNFRLLERVCSRGVAWIATAFLIAGPPSLVLWSMSGSAEIVMTLIAGAVLLLAVENSLLPALNVPAYRASPYSIYIAGAALGFGLWVQQFILYYVVSLAVTAAIVTPGWRAAIQEAIRARVPAWMKAILLALAGVAGLYLLLGLMAFLGAGFQTRGITATHPQKMWWIAGVLLATTVAVVTVCVFRGRLFGPSLAFLAGYAPAIIARLGNHGMGAPISRLDAATLRAVLPDVTHVMLPILFGWRDPLARPTVFPGLAIVIVVIAAVSYWLAWRRTVTPFFHVFPLVAAVMFFVSGSYIDAQSYRYLMPIYATLPVVCAVGVVGLWRANRIAGAAMCAAAVTIFVAQQIVWYKQLEPDRDSQRVLECLDAAGVRAARASYWESYKLTFLSGERIIVSPLDGMDRYPKYSEQTREAPNTSRQCP
jgi:hypothetical protein